MRSTHTAGAHRRFAPQDPVGHRVRYLRVAKGWSQRQLALRAGVNPSTISRVERGVRGVATVTMADVLARALGCQLEDLLSLPAQVPGAPTSTRRAVPGALDDVHQALLVVSSAHRRPSPTATAGARSLRYVEEQARVARQRRNACDYSELLPVAAGALRGLSPDLHADPRGVTLTRLAPVLFDVCAALVALDDLGYAWMAVERCRDAAAASEDRTLAQATLIAAAAVLVKQGLDGDALGLVAGELVRGEGGPHRGTLHVLALIAGGRAGMDVHQAREHHAQASRIAQGLQSQPRTRDVLDIGFDAAFVRQARFYYCVDRRDVAGAQDALRHAAGCLSTAPAHRADFYVALARFHHLRADHARALDSLAMAEMTAPQHAHAHTCAHQLLAELAGEARSEALQQRAAGTWARYRR